jgi:hypothetical protein
VEQRKHVNSFIKKCGVYYLFLFLMLGGILYLLDISFEKSLKICLFFYLFSIFVLVISGYIKIFDYYFKKQGRSLLEIKWHELLDFEKKFYITTEKIIYLLCLFALEGACAIILILFLLTKLKS